jgi:Uma2 family endonuclease
VLSKNTRRIDEVEKKETYLELPSLALYLLADDHRASVTAFRRTEQGFVGEVYEGQAAVIPLPEIETDLPLADVYARVEFTPEPDGEE